MLQVIHSLETPDREASWLAWRDSGKGRKMAFDTNGSSCAALTKRSHRAAGYTALFP